MKKTILITGGTGLVGTRLSERLAQKGHRVLHLSRRANLEAQFPAYQWDAARATVAPEALQQADAVVHLAGAGIADKAWTPARKREILESRTQTTRLLAEQLAHFPNIRTVVSATAIGFYGNTGSVLCDENTASGTGFLADVSRAWEKAVDGFDAVAGLRSVRLRVGIVLSTQGGALAKMLPSYSVFAGAYFGNGEQYYSWIHLDDLADMFIFALENEGVNGIYNAVASQPVSNKTLAFAIGEALQKPAFIAPAPAFALRLAMGEMADAVLMGSRVSAEKIQQAGFAFAFPALAPALRDLIHRRA